MQLELVDLNDEQQEDINNRLEEFDKKHIAYEMKGEINIGFCDGEKLAAGAIACITAFKILYVSTLYVDEQYRGRGVGKQLVAELEKRAKLLGANIIRLDTFNWQGAEFYKSLGYEQVGFYQNEEDNFSEHFFIKRLTAKATEQYNEKSLGRN